ncbi:hypothetical protein OX88_08790 [Pseudomonas coronafaciens pv. porri]|uniref:P-loop NTPase fold protein n=1 Tax=Pseudomonas coronafaciens TaxID=53409 RepID=UPI0006ABA36F|nr:P-loop NTPase fold protein [Pseudomonas coronafaciens]KOP56562.1 hypothetical protein OX88_08790 [Pseudomonas coronafaciens pv. porri]
MSVKKVEQALYEFAVKKSGSAIVLKGEWGTGKTFIWDKVIKEHRLAVDQAKYSYVSLFGINSLAELKRSIYEHTVDTVKVGDVSTTQSILTNLANLDFTDAKSAVRKGLGLTGLAKIPYVGSVSSVVDSVQYALVSKTLVCIDDFERRGNSLTARDVLGLVSNLIESKKCSVLLILNEGSLQKDDEFFTYSEKVFDYEVRYSPTLDEATSVVFSSTDDYENKIVENVKKLRINNIRLIRKVRYFANLVKPYLKDAPLEIIDKATLLIPLAIYAKYAGADKAVGIEDLVSYRIGFSVFATEKADFSEGQQPAVRKKNEVRDFFNAYGFYGADEFTIEIINLINNGFASSDSIESLIESIAFAIDESNKRKQIGEAWRVFQHDINVSSNELLGMFEKAIRDSGDMSSPSEIDGIYEIFKAGDAEPRGRALVDYYFDAISKSGGYTHRKEFARTPNSDYVVQKLEKYLSETTKVYSIDELCESFCTQSFSSEVVELLSKFSTDQFHGYFKRLDSTNFVAYANALVALGSRSDSNEPETIFDIVFKNVFAALKRIHDESPLMSLRLNKFMIYEQLYDAKTKINPAG